MTKIIDNTFVDFDPQGFNDFDPEDFDGFDEPDNIKGRGRARRADKRDKKFNQKQTNRDRKDKARERRLIIKASKAPTPMVDTLNNSPSLEDQASQNNMSVDMQAEKLISPYNTQIQTMLNKGGVAASPTGNIAENATRFLLMRQNDAIARQQAQMDSLYDEGMSDDEVLTHVQSPDEIEEDQIRADMEEFGDSFDNFFPAAYSAIKNLGKMGVQKIKDSRAAKDATIQEKTKLEEQAKAEKEKAALLIQAEKDKSDSLSKMRDEFEKKAKEHAPIIIGVIILIAVVCTFYFLGKKKAA